MKIGIVMHLASRGNGGVFYLKSTGKIALSISNPNIPMKKFIKWLPSAFILVKKDVASDRNSK